MLVIIYSALRLRTFRAYDNACYRLRAVDMLCSDVPVTALTKYRDAKPVPFDNKKLMKDPILFVYRHRCTATDVAHRLIDACTEYLGGVMRIECVDRPADGDGAHGRFIPKR